MKKLSVLFAFTVLFTSAAYAQATRTWVSGVGDDVNPCSRTAPCKTFAGAISKTATGGEISVLDPGGFGAVTITKAIRIDGKSFVASVLAAGTQGVVINAGTGRVELANIEINGAGTGTNGINVISAGSVTISHVEITDFVNNGITIATTATVPVQVFDSHIQNVPAGNGILSSTSAAQPVRLLVRNTTIANCNVGLHTSTGTDATLSSSTLTGNATGAQADSASFLNVDRSNISSNTGFGIVSLANSSVIRVYNSFIQNNPSGGFNVTAPSSIGSAQNNSIQSGVGSLGNIGQQ